jgi:hypothetical protein
MIPLRACIWLPDTVENPVEKVKVLETQIGTLETAACGQALLRRLVFD